MENLTPVTLVVKAANQKIADQTVECALNWTVKKLKQHLSAVYPNKPVSNLEIGALILKNVIKYHCASESLGFMAF